MKKNKAVIKKIVTVISVAALVMLMPLQALAMQIYVETPNTETVTLDCESGDVVINIKGKIQDKIYISPECQSLYFNENLLADEKTLADYNIQKESTLKLVVSGDDIKYSVVITVDDSEKDIGVYVKYVDNTEWNTVPIDENGKGTDTLPDGTEIEINGADSTKGTLIIDPITDKEALAWIGSVTDGKVKTPQAFHIYYLDDNGNITEADGVTVTVKPKDMPQNAVVYSLNTDGKATQLDFTAKDGAVTFTTNGDPYYVIGEKVSTSTTPGGNAPQTGDNGNMTLWIALLLAGGGLLVGTAAYRKKTNRSIRN